MRLYELVPGGGLRPTESALFTESQASSGVLRWVRMVSPQPSEIDSAISVMELKRCHAFIPVTDGAQNQLRDLISDGGRGLKLLSEMENRLRDLRQHQQQALQESTNRRLNMLAILSSIYMPATLIAGIYGMNFENIPITTVSHGYYIVMAFMAVVVLGHFWYFFRRGWFK